MTAIDAQPAILTVLAYSFMAAALSALGAVPFYFRRTVALRWVGWSYACASGLMLGAVYVLITEGLKRQTLPSVVGAALGVLYTYWTHAYTGSDELATGPEEDVAQGQGIKFILLNALHSASEGVAIGAAMVVDLRLGIFMALALATHNIAEALVLTDLLRRTGTPQHQAMGLCITTNVPQVLLAIVAFAIVSAVPEYLPWALGFAAGAMVYLVMTELLPSSYERSGRTAIAVIVTLAMGAVIFLRGLILPS